ncbi:ZN414 protein, partial [Ramphastos sulfuratus]|nr:ZN414 protein [Ramphastos sulfuratus]
AQQPARAARLAGGAAAAAVRSPLPAAGAQPVRAGLPGSLLGAAAAAALLGAGPVPALRAPLGVQPAAAHGAAPPAAPAAGPRRLQRRLEEEPRWASSVPPSCPILAGHSSNSRIVWEHTRGRYTCMQCAYSAASRQEMTLHIEEHRKNPPQPGRLDAEMDFGVGLTSFHTKLTPEMENSLYSQL